MEPFRLVQAEGPGVAPVDRQGHRLDAEPAQVRRRPSAAAGARSPRPWTSGRTPTVQISARGSTPPSGRRLGSRRAEPQQLARRRLEQQRGPRRGTAHVGPVGLDPLGVELERRRVVREGGVEQLDPRAEVAVAVDRPDAGPVGPGGRRDGDVRARGPGPTASSGTRTPSPRRTRARRVVVGQQRRGAGSVGRAPARSRGPPRRAPARSPAVGGRARRRAP